MPARPISALAAAALALAGCSGLIKTTTSTSTSTSTSSTPGPVAGAPDGSSVAPGSDVVVPDLIGKTPEEAAALVAAAGFTQAVESTRPVECYDAPEIDGKINCQQPHAGETVKNYTLVQVNVYRTQRIAGAVVRSQMVALIGMSPDQAKAALASYGHDGLVSVEVASAYDEACGQDRVCGFNRPEGGMGIHDAIRLYVNPPPPE